MIDMPMLILLMSSLFVPALTFIAWEVATGPGMFDAFPMKLLFLDFAIIGCIAYLVLKV